MCPAENEDLPCPAPAGATLPWQVSPAELAMPGARAGSVVFQSGSTLYVIGGETDSGATAEVLVTHVTSDEEGNPLGNLTSWSEGPALPEPRADATMGIYAGIPFVVGGLDASGAPTDTVYKGIVEEGALTGWELADGTNGTDELTLPQPVSDASVVLGTSGFVLIGGRGADGAPTDGVHVAWVDEVTSSGRLLAWEPLPGLALPEARAGAVAASAGDYVYVVGGEGADGATDSVFRLELVDREPATNEVGEPLGWAVASSDQVLPEPRMDAVGFAASGAIYVIGGLDVLGESQPSVLWAVPDTSTGDIDGGWQRLDQTDLVVATANAPIAGVGSYAFIFGGETPDGLTDASQRADLSPRPPFYRLGVAGVTIPALSIKGEVGQQLGYMNAMGVGVTNFVLLIIIGIAFSRPDSSKRVLSRLSRGRLPMPPEDQYRS
jgi:hypothetical protein